ncbi:MAG: hypothetical protein RH859_10170 [Longimicrobiales bacterium]
MAGTGGARALEWLAVVGMLVAGIAGMWGSELVVISAGGRPDEVERRSRARLRAFEVDELPPGAEDVRAAVRTSEGIACGRDAPRRHPFAGSRRVRS